MSCGRSVGQIFFVNLSANLSTMATTRAHGRLLIGCIRTTFYSEPLDGKQTTSLYTGLRLISQRTVEWELAELSTDLRKAQPNGIMSF